MRQILLTVLSIVLLIIVIIGTISTIDLTIDPKWRECKVVSVWDGDHLTLKIDGKKVSAKLAGADAPNAGQPFYRQSTAFVRNTTDSMLCQWAVVDRDGDTEYGILRFDDGARAGEELNRILLREGYAWWDLDTSYDSSLEDLELMARDEGLGMWAPRGDSDGS